MRRAHPSAWLRTLSSARDGALRIERDGHVLRVTLAQARAPQRVRRGAHRRADRGVRRRRRCARGRALGRRAELLRRRRRRVAARLDRPLLRGERRGRDAPLPDARGDRLLPRAGGLLRPRIRARRRLRPRRVRRHRGRLAGRGVRVLRGAARDHPGRDLSVRARRRSAPPRAATSSPASASTRRRRCGSGSCQEVSEDAGETRRGDRARHPRRRARRRARGEAARARAARRRRRPRTSRPRGERATRDRTGSARSSSAAHPAGSRTAD